MRTEFKIDDGGRSKYFPGTGGDCVARSIAIITGRDYMDVYNELAEGNKSQRKSKNDRGRNKKSALEGISVKRKWFKDYMFDQGFKWVPTMEIGSGCTTHLCSGELPKGRLILSLSRHYTSMINGVIHDNYSPQRIWTRNHIGEIPKTNEFIHENGKTIHEEKRCVYGYWILNIITLWVL